jgi:hypothetical protein
VGPHRWSERCGKNKVTVRYSLISNTDIFHLLFDTRTGLPRSLVVIYYSDARLHYREVRAAQSKLKPPSLEDGQTLDTIK